MKHHTKPHPKNESVECLSCEEDVYVGRNPKIGKYIICNNCDATFQIIDIDPVLIDWPEDDDDYTDDDAGFYDDVYNEYDS